MASTAFLTLPELLDTILIHLDVKTLLLSQRVSKQWQAAIARSHELQCKLYFRQRPEGPTREYNPLLLWKEDASNWQNTWCDDCGTFQYYALDSGDLDGTFLDCSMYDNKGSSAMRMYLVSTPGPVWPVGRERPTVGYNVRESREPDVYFECINVAEDRRFRWACKRGKCYLNPRRVQNDDDALGKSRCFPSKASSPVRNFVKWVWSSLQDNTRGCPWLLSTTIIATEAQFECLTGHS